MKKNNLILFSFLTLLVLVFNYSLKHLLSINELIVNELMNKIEINQFESILDFQRKWQWIIYAITPLLLLLKVTIITLVLDIGCFFFNTKIKFGRLFNIVVKAEFIFLLVIVFKTIWFYFFQTDYTFEDIQYFYPLSAINIVGYKDLQDWLIYPFQVLNLFEIAYWFILAFLIGRELKLGIDKGLSIVLSSYGVGLFVWVVGVVFLTLNLS